MRRFLFPAFLQRELPLRVRLPRAGFWWLLLALLLLVISWLRVLNLLMLLAYLMVLLWLANFFLAGRRLHLLRSRRRIEGPVFAQVLFTEQLEIANDDTRPQCGVRLTDAARSPVKSGCFLARLEAGASVAFARQAVLPRRGRWPGTALIASSGHPFGLVERRTVLGGGPDVLVLPRLGRLHLDQLRQFLQQAPPLTDRRQSVARPEARSTAEVHGIRPYYPGDSPRWIHWRSTARHGELMVREFETPVGASLVLVLDLQQPSLATQSADLVEDAVSLAATICWTWCQKRENQLLLALAGPAPLVLDSRTAPEQGLRFLESLAEATAYTDDHVSPLCGLLPASSVPAGAVLVISPAATALPSLLCDHWRRPVAVVRATDLATHGFYERPTPHGP